MFSVWHRRKGVDSHIERHDGIVVPDEITQPLQAEGDKIAAIMGYAWYGRAQLWNWREDGFTLTPLVYEDGEWRFEANSPRFGDYYMGIKGDLAPSGPW